MRYDKLAAITGGTLYNTEAITKIFTGVGIDSRTIGKDQLFVAIKGERTDGHKYIKSALKNGASGLLVEYNYPSLDMLPGNIPVVSVMDSHKAMMLLAKEYRNTIDARFIGITGSNGKTTTKEILYSLLNALETGVYKSPGNLNNLFGVPLAMFGIPTGCNLAVFEMGISTKHEMPKLAEMVRPDIAVLTNIGPSHLAYLSSVEEVAQAKLEIIKHSGKNIPVVINADDKVLFNEAHKACSHVVTFGFNAEADFHPDKFDIDENGSSHVVIENNNFKLKLPGKHQVYNLLAGYAVCRSLGYGFENVDTAAIEFDTAPMRGQKIELGEITFISDCYNANPASVKVGLEAFFSIPTHKQRVIILGDMLELGSDASRYHKEIGRLLSQFDFDRAILVGTLSINYRVGGVERGLPLDKFIHFDTAVNAAKEIKSILKHGQIVYLKGSRGIGLERILEVFQPGGEM